MTDILKQNKGTLAEPQTGKDIPVQSDKPDIGHMGSLSLVKKYSRPKAHFYVTEWDLKYCMHEAAFPNNSFLKLLDCTCKGFARCLTLVFQQNPQLLSLGDT